MSTQNKNISDMVFNHTLPTFHIDSILVAHRQDEMNMIHLFSKLPQNSYEQTRFIAHDKLLKHFIDSICEKLDYYPTKPSKINPKK